MDFIFIIILSLITLTSLFLNIYAKRLHHKNFLKIRNTIRKHQIKTLKKLYTNSI
jgi:hypothetical protein